MRNRLKDLRAEQGWSQAELAERIGVSRQAVNAIETEKHEPSLGLAPIMVETIGTMIAGIRDRGATVLLVEQNAALALRLADRAYVLETGRVTLEGLGG